jgi:quercetin dioxygenase-like cupin family protein
MMNIKHHFSSGVYAKEIRLVPGESVVSHKHKFDHISILAAGAVTVEIDGQESRYCAPACITIKAGEHHKITALMRPVIWYCIHSTTERDVEKIDEVLTDEPDMAAVVHLVTGE